MKKYLHWGNISLGAGVLVAVGSISLVYSFKSEQREVKLFFFLILLIYQKKTKENEKINQVGR